MFWIKITIYFFDHFHLFVDKNQKLEPDIDQYLGKRLGLDQALLLDQAKDPDQENNQHLDLEQNRKSG